MLDGTKSNIAVTRDGEVFEIGDVVYTNWHRSCIGQEFVIEEIYHYAATESGYLVRVHLNGHPDRVLKTSNGVGLDTNWFFKVKTA